MQQREREIHDLNIMNAELKVEKDRLVPELSSQKEEIKQMRLMLTRLSEEKKTFFL